MIMEFTDCLSTFEDFLRTKETFQCSCEEIVALLQTISRDEKVRDLVRESIMNTPSPTFKVDGQTVSLSSCYLDSIKQIQDVLQEDKTGKLSHVMQQIRKSLGHTQRKTIGEISTMLDISGEEKVSVRVCEQRQHLCRAKVKMHHYLLLEGLQDVVASLLNNENSLVEDVWKSCKASSAPLAMQKVGMNQSKFEKTLNSYPEVFQVEDGKVFLNDGPRITHSLILSHMQSGKEKLKDYLLNQGPLLKKELFRSTAQLLSRAEVLAMGGGLEAFTFTLLSLQNDFLVIPPHMLVIAQGTSHVQDNPFVSAIAKIKDYIRSEGAADGSFLSQLVTFANQNLDPCEQAAVGNTIPKIRETVVTYPDHFGIEHDTVFIKSDATILLEGTSLRIQSLHVTKVNQRTMADRPSSDHSTEYSEDSAYSDALDDPVSPGIDDGGSSVRTSSLGQDEVESLGSESISDSESLHSGSNGEVENVDPDMVLLDQATVTVLQDQKYFGGLITEFLDKANAPVLSVSLTNSWLIVGLWDCHTFAISLDPSWCGHQKMQGESEASALDFLTNKSILKVVFGEKLLDEINDALRIKMVNVFDLKMACNLIRPELKGVQTLPEALTLIGVDPYATVEVCNGTIQAPLSGDAYTEEAIIKLKDAARWTMKQVPYLYQKILGMMTSYQITKVSRLHTEEDDHHITASCREEPSCSIITKTGTEEPISGTLSHNNCGEHVSGTSANASSEKNTIITSASPQSSSQESIAITSTSAKTSSEEPISSTRSTSCEEPLSAAHSNVSSEEYTAMTSPSSKTSSEEPVSGTQSSASSEESISITSPSSKPSSDIQSKTSSEEPICGTSSQTRCEELVSRTQSVTNSEEFISITSTSSKPSPKEPISCIQSKASLEEPTTGTPSKTSSEEPISATHSKEPDSRTSSQTSSEQPKSNASSQAISEKLRSDNLPKNSSEKPVSVTSSTTRSEKPDSVKSSKTSFKELVSVTSAKISLEISVSGTSSSSEKPDSCTSSKINSEKHDPVTSSKTSSQKRETGKSSKTSSENPDSCTSSKISTEKPDPSTSSKTSSQKRETGKSSKTSSEKPVSNKSSKTSSEKPVYVTSSKSSSDRPVTGTSSKVSSKISGSGKSSKANADKPDSGKSSKSSSQKPDSDKSSKTSAEKPLSVASSKTSSKKPVSNGSTASSEKPVSVHRVSSTSGDVDQPDSSTRDHINHDPFESEEKHQPALHSTSEMDSTFKDGGSIFRRKLKQAQTSKKTDKSSGSTTSDTTSEQWTSEQDSAMVNAKVLHYDDAGKPTLIPFNSKLADKAINPCQISHELSTEFSEIVMRDQDKFLEAFGICIKYNLKKLSEQHKSLALDQLTEVVMDVGRKPSARYYQPEHLGQLKVRTIGDKPLTKQDLKDFMDGHCSPVSSDHRSSINGTLHRVGIMCNRHNEPIGLTALTKHAVLGCATPLFDLMNQGQSILFVGNPGVGKSTLLREAARVINDVVMRRVVIVDTCNEIAGDGDIPHPSVGGARRVQLLDRDAQPSMIREVVRNHSPQTLVIDELVTEADAAAVLGTRQRGIQVISTAPGQTLQDVILNPNLAHCSGRIQNMAVNTSRGGHGDSAGVPLPMMQRTQPAAFDVLVEMHDRYRWIIHTDFTRSIDMCLQKESVSVQERRVVMKEVAKDSEGIPEVMVQDLVVLYPL